MPCQCFGAGKWGNEKGDRPHSCAAPGGRWGKWGPYLFSLPGSVRHVRDHLAVSHPVQISKRLHINRLTDEMDRPVGEDEVDPARMQTGGVVPASAAADDGRGAYFRELQTPFPCPLP